MLNGFNAATQVGCSNSEDSRTIKQDKSYGQTCSVFGRGYPHRATDMSCRMRTTMMTKLTDDGEEAKYDGEADDDGEEEEAEGKGEEEEEWGATLVRASRRSRGLNEHNNKGNELLHRR